MENIKNFYQKFFPIFWVIAVCTIPIAVIAGYFDFEFVIWKTLLLLIFVIGVDIAGTYLIIKMPVTVSPEGFKFIDWMWTYQFASWSNIRFVKPNRVFFGLPYLRIGLNDSKDVIWLPLLLNEFPEFINLVKQFAGEDNLLTKELVHHHTKE